MEGETLSYTCNHCGEKLLGKEELYEHLKRWHRALPKKEKRDLRKTYDRMRKDAHRKRR
jgi:hypothetical protein